MSPCVCVCVCVCLCLQHCAMLGHLAPVYCVLFDKTGQRVITVSLSH